MPETLDSKINLVLGNIPDLGGFSQEEIFEAILRLHAAMEILVSYYDEAGGEYVTIGDAQDINGAKTFKANTIFDLTVALNGDITVGDAINFILNTVTGTKFGTAATQKLSLWGVTPVVQPAGVNQAALTNSSGGTYDGTIQAVAGSGADAAINNNFTELHTLLDEIRTALVNAGIIKGSA
jgi:hypothetical protein